MRPLQTVRAVLIQPVKMMDRPMAAADTETIGARNRRTDPGLGMTNRGFQLLAFGKAGGDGRGQ